MPPSVIRWSGISLILGAIALPIFWLGSRLYLGWKGIFGFGFLLVLSTFFLIFGLAGVHSVQRYGPVERWLGLAGVLITALGLLVRVVIAPVGVALLSIAGYRTKPLPNLGFLLVLAGTLLLAFEEVNYGVLLAVRNDEPISAGTPLANVRWIVAIGFALQSIGWVWLGTAVRTGKRE